MKITNLCKLTGTGLLSLSLLTPMLFAQATPLRPEITPAVKNDVSPPLRDLISKPDSGTQREIPLRSIPLPSSSSTDAPDQAVQSSASRPLAGTTPGLNFAGIGKGDYGYSVTSAPPDTNGAVGDTQYVQIVNTDFAVFNKTTGAIQLGPKKINTVWSGFGGGCQTNNDGDPTVLYDKVAKRWIISQFSVSTTPYLQCVAVSTTSDATGTYNRYAFSYGNVAFPDYPKMGVWPDAYYITFNIFNNGTTYAGAKACAYDRAKMLAGQAATQQCFDLGTSYGSLLPADLDGNTPSPSGSPNYLVNFGTNKLNLWKFKVDWVNTANTALTGPTSLPVAAFTAACNGGTCITQSGTTQKLDSLADRLMYRLAYRNRSGTESLMVTHSVKVGTTRTAPSGIRWYELRIAGGTPSVFQQSTFAPDSTYRWMGSIAMDKLGNMAVGYSASSSAIHPAIRYTGRLVSDPLNTMQAENSIIEGTGSQTSNLSRWGDYSAMSVDPVDDCTFWYTNEYQKANGSFNWSTRIASFKFPSCN
jgi:hypothetical protein